MHNQTTIANKLTSNNINIRTGNNLNSVSTIINDTTIDTVDTLINMANNNNNSNNNNNNNSNNNNNNNSNNNNNTTKLNLNIGNSVSIALAEERHEHEEVHDTWGGDIGRAALGGAITGLASSIGIKGGEYLGNMASTSITTNSVLSTSINASVNAATMSTMNTIGTAMSNTTIYGGNFKDVLKSGRDSLRNKDNLKSIAVSTLGAGITTGITTKLNIVKPTTFTDKLTKNAIDSATNTALQSTINGDSFKDTLKHQVVNSLVMTGAEYGANSIGTAYHNNSFSNNNFVNKATQLTLHAGLGAVSSKLTGGDYLSGAISGVVGEVVGEYFRDNGYSKKDGSELAGLVSGLSSIIVSKASGDDVNEISKNAYAGQRVGQNAAENNSYFVNKNKKSVVVIDDGDYNAYVVDNDVSREEIEQNPENYKNESILYSDVFLDSDKKLSGDDLTLAEKSFNNEEVHNELLLLDSFDKNKSISDNIYDLLDNEKIDIQTAIVLKRALDNGADDFSLSYLMANNLWSGIADNSDISKGNVNPTKNIMNTFDISLDISRFSVNPANGNEPRESIGCITTGCGEFGALRDGGGRTHNGIDIITQVGDYIISGADGTIENTSTIDKKTKVKLPGINIYSSNGIIQTLYVQSGNDEKTPIKDGTKVEQGNIVGKSIDIKKNPTYSDTVNHIHTEIFEKYENVEIKNSKTNKTKTKRVKINNQDPTNIIFPNKKKVEIGLPNNK